MVCSVLIIFTKVIAKILYAKEFYNAWIYVPMLLISIIFGAMSGLIGGVFSAVKDSKIFSVSTTIGAVFNIVFNIVLINFVGSIGSAISTAISYFLVWAIRIINVRKYMTLKLNIRRDLLAYGILILQSIIVGCIQSNYSYLYNLILLLIIYILYYKEIVRYFNKVVLIFNERNNRK